MKKLQSGDKIVQKMTRDGAVELNKTTGSAASISARDAPASSGINAMPIIGGAVSRVQSERNIAKRKRMVKKANKQIYERSNRKPEVSKLQ